MDSFECFCSHGRDATAHVHCGFGNGESVVRSRRGEGTLLWSPVARLLQPSKAPLPMLSTESGMVSETIWGHAHSFWGKPVLYANSVMLVVPDVTLTWVWQP